MRLILLGLPGAGKGTQAKVLAERLGLLHISTGDMFRQASAEGTELGRRAQEFMSAGKLVPDEVTIGMLLERISKPDASLGFMLDGFPRTIPQAEALDQVLEARDEAIDAVLYIQVPEADLMARLTGRWTCAQCGAIYHEQTSPPKQAGVCDLDGTALTQREDDRPDTVRARLDTNREWTEALAGYYRRAGKLHEVDGTGDPTSITTRLLDELAGVQSAREKA
ncbi:MAG: adenylate kinase [Dehalococcoidia bacterium]|nr:adenylate kinase [Dehalococcoidia bacterium]